MTTLKLNVSNLRYMNGINVKFYMLGLIRARKIKLKQFLSFVHLSDYFFCNYKCNWMQPENKSVTHAFFTTVLGSLHASIRPKMALFCICRAFLRITILYFNIPNLHNNIGFLLQHNARNLKFVKHTGWVRSREISSYVGVSELISFKISLMFRYCLWFVIYVP